MMTTSASTHRAALQLRRSEPRSITSQGQNMPRRALFRPSPLSKHSVKSVSSRRAPVTLAAAAPGGQMLIYVPPHPLIKHWMAVARNEMTPGPAFRAAIAELGRLLIYECVRDWLPTVEGEIKTPMGMAEAECVDPSQPIKVVPILRAGLVILEQAGTVLPLTQTYHLGMSRDEETLEPTIYLDKLPKTFSPEDRVLICDPMLATGGTMLAAMDLIVSRGASPENIRIISIVAAPPALSKLSEKYKEARVYTAMIDAEVDDNGFIVPGLGDAGDRAFDTL